MGWFSDALDSLTGAVGGVVGGLVSAVAEPVGGLLQQAAPLVGALAPIAMAGMGGGGLAGMLGGARPAPAPGMMPGGFGMPLQPQPLTQAASLFGGQTLGSPFTSQQRFSGFGVASQGSQFAYGNTPQSSLANAYGTSRFALAGTGRNVSSFATPYGVPPTTPTGFGGPMFGGMFGQPQPRPAPMFGGMFGQPQPFTGPQFAPPMPQFQMPAGPQMQPQPRAIDPGYGAPAAQPSTGFWSQFGF